MSLRVWLPLNGTLENKGISNISVTNNGATVDASGKIGSCYSFNGSTGYISLVGTQLFQIFTGGTQQFSITMWVYHADATRAILFGDYSTSGAINFNMELSTGHGVRFYWNGSPDTYPSNAIVAASGWTHVALTYNGSLLQSYINGIAKGSWSGTLGTKNKTSGEFRLGRDSRSDSTAFNGKMNDFRVYDHCLSAAEVKEISQGLVLHYKLDSGYNESTTNLCGTGAGGWNNSGTCTRTANDTAIPGKPTTSNTYSVRATSDGSMALTCGTTTANHPSKTIIASVYVWLDGTQDSSTFYLRSTKTDGSVGVLYYNGNSNPSQWPQKQWIRISTNAISTASDATTFYICTYINKNTEVRAVNGWQIEEKDHITPYTAPGTTRTNTTVQDSSGYGYNGTIVGNPIISNDTARFSHSLNFNGTDIITRNTLSADIRTLSCWVKTTKNKSTSQMMVADSASNMCISFYSGTIIGVFGTTRSTGSKSTLGDSYKENDWNHIVVVKVDDTGARDIYCNGVKLAAAANDYWSSSAGFHLGNRKSTTDGNTKFYGYLSDVRAYCTALSADDILQLYHTSAKVDNLHGVHTYEFIENSSNIKLYKTGQFKAGEFQETTTTKFYKTNKIVETNNLVEF